MSGLNSLDYLFATVPALAATGDGMNGSGEQGESRVSMPAPPYSGTDSGGANPNEGGTDIVTDSEAAMVLRYRAATASGMAAAISFAEVKAAAEEDWAWVGHDLAAMIALADLIATRHCRERGEVPPSYTDVVQCRSCGPIWIFPGGAPVVLACPWCLNELPGRDRIPRPPAGAGGGGAYSIALGIGLK